MFLSPFHALSPFLLIPVVPAILLEKPPDSAIGHAEARADLAKRHPLANQFARLVALFRRELALTSCGERSGIVPLDEAEDHPIGDAELLGDLLRRLARLDEFERLLALRRRQLVRAIGWRTQIGMCASGLRRVKLFTQPEAIVALLPVGAQAQRQDRQHVRARNQPDDALPLEVIDDPIQRE